ncbi:hypothetical protein PR202_gb10841 [Eleusine coracana subsp. coracana]|uniref:Uncharacterized protein n=1 Tax=Eleusine coracana subsp. coracana TaxID=191504 RepID=A0AAV5ELH6_ELECO|nr:hypothetical protein PR202_gb10841 [Eleusine coracana subsp. coracana]
MHAIKDKHLEESSSTGISGRKPRTQYKQGGKKEKAVGGWVTGEGSGFRRSARRGIYRRAAAGGGNGICELDRRMGGERRKTTRRVGWVGALRCRFLTSRPAREVRNFSSFHC